VRADAPLAVDFTLLAIAVCAGSLLLPWLL
jgi:hypothetical protein